MRALFIVTALALAAPAAAQAVKPSVGKPPAVQSPGTKPKPSATEAEAAKAQATNEAQQKAWDERTRRAMRGICQGC